ncbi:MAG: sodium-independent anion transporter, partial [Clostridia bacterium]|nr:sodium-independent anion transporter [Clostridia bacterium]
MKKIKLLFRPKLIDCLKGYNVSTFVSDFGAGVSVGILALPLAMAFAIASGVSPAQGIYTAIIAGFIISVFGGSKVQIGGPTGAFIVIVSGIVLNPAYGFSGLCIATVLAGVILIVMGFAKMGNAIRYIPRPVTIGFTNGIAILIMSTQIKDFFGLTIEKMPEDFIPKIGVIFNNFSTLNYPTLVLGIISLLVIVFWPKHLRRYIPGQIGAIFIGVAISLVFAQFGWNVETIGTRFGEIPNTLPHVEWISIDFSNIKHLIMPAVTIAILAAIESLLSAVVADGMIDDKHNSNQELIAQGMANVITPFFGGIPATGAIARTATNIKNGGKTPMAGIIHAGVLLLIMMLLGKFAVYIPMAALSAVLVSVAWNMAGLPAVKALLKGQKSDICVLLVTFLITVFVDLTVAIEVGLGFAAFFFIKKMIDVSEVQTKHTVLTGGIS